MLIYYVLMAAFATCNLAIFAASQNKRANTYFALLFYLAFISNFGYLALAMSTNLEEALLANKICYFGGCFLPVCIFLAILQICNYSMPRIYCFLLFAASIIMYICVLSTGYCDIYYKSVSLSNVNGVSVLVKEYGPMHTVYYILLVSYVIWGLGIIAYTIIKRKHISYKNMLLLILMECSAIIAFILGKLLFSQCEIMPVIYVISEWVFLYISRRLNMYDMEGTISNSIERQHTYGYITFDLNHSYIGSNSVAMDFFPELAGLKIDFPIAENVEPIFDCFIQWMDELKDDGLVKSYKRNDVYYQCTIRHIYYDKKKCGYLIEIIDDTSRQKYINLLSNYNSELVRTVDEKTAHIRAMQDKILFAMGNMVENRDTNTGGHINRTSYVVSLLIDAIREGGEFNLSDSFCDAVIKSAPMHDLGKIAIDDSILRKPGKFTPEEFEIMKTHSEKGANIVKSILDGVEDTVFVDIAQNIAHYHHEKWDGTGYPNHLSGEDIPLEARIMAIADVYDALVSKRCYKEKMSFDEAYNIIKDSMGKHFDPKLFVYFDHCHTQLEEYYSHSA